MTYPIVKIKKCLTQVVLFTEPNTGTVIDNFRGNIKGYSSDEWEEDEFIDIETILSNHEVIDAILTSVLTNK